MQRLRGLGNPGGRGRVRVSGGGGKIPVPPASCWGLRPQLGGDLLGTSAGQDLGLEIPA